MSRDIVWTTKFKKDYKLAIYRIENDLLVLTLSRTGTHGDLFEK